MGGYFKEDLLLEKSEENSSGRLELALAEKEDADSFMRGRGLGVGLDLWQDMGSCGSQKGEQIWGQKPVVFGTKCVGSQGPAKVTWGLKVGGTRGAGPGIRASTIQSMV